MWADGSLSVWQGSSETQWRRRRLGILISSSHPSLVRVAPGGIHLISSDLLHCSTCRMGESPGLEGLYPSHEEHTCSGDRAGTLELTQILRTLKEDSAWGFGAICVSEWTGAGCPKSMQCTASLGETVMAADVSDVCI